VQSLKQDGYYDVWGGNYFTVRGPDSYYHWATATDPPPGLAWDASRGCFRKNGSGDVVIDHWAFRSSVCGKPVVCLDGADGGGKVTFQSCLFSGGDWDSAYLCSYGATGAGFRHGAGIEVVNRGNVTVEECSFEYLGGRALYFIRYGSAAPMDDILVHHNRSYMPKGYWEGAPEASSINAHFVQLNGVTGQNIKIRTNRVMCPTDWQCYMNDQFNLYESSGTPSSPIALSDNAILGGGTYQYNGAGFVIGDHAYAQSGHVGGSYSVVDDNVMVFPPPVAGATIAGGYDNRVTGNFIYTDGSFNAYKPGTPNGSWINYQAYAAIQLWDYGDGTLNAGHTVADNRVFCPLCYSAPGCCPNDPSPLEWGKLIRCHANAVVENNDLDMTLTPAELLPAQFMSHGCVAKNIRWGNGKCKAVALGRDHGWASTLQAEPGAAGTIATLCNNGVWETSNPVCY
jgi:hypothetical protein